MGKKYIIGLDASKELINWFAGKEVSEGETELEALYWASSQKVCDKENPIIYITSILKSRLEDYSDDTSISEMLQESFFQAVKDEDIDGCLNANESTVKQASLIQFLKEDYIVICKNTKLIEELQEQGLTCIELKDFKYE